MEDRCHVAWPAKTHFKLFGVTIDLEYERDWMRLWSQPVCKGLMQASGSNVEYILLKFERFTV